MAGLEEVAGHAFAVVHGSERLHHLVDGVGCCQHIAGVTSFAGRVHVADGESDGGGGCVDGCQHGCHGIGSGGPAHRAVWDGAAMLSGDVHEDVVERAVGDGSAGEGEPASHVEVGVVLVLASWGCTVVVRHIDTDDHVRLHLAGHDAAAEAADLFVGGAGTEHTDTAGADRRKHVHDLGRDETAEAVVQVGAGEGVGEGPRSDQPIEDDGIALSDTQRFHLSLGVVAVGQQLQVELLGADAFGTGPHVLRREVDGADGLDGSTQWAVLACGGIHGEEDHLVAQQRHGQEGVGVDPDLSVLGDAADLHADLVGVADDHGREHVVSAGVGVQHDAGIANEFTQGPAFGHPAPHVWSDDALSHGCFEPHRARRAEDVSHEGEVRFGHGEVPGFLFHRYCLLLRPVVR